MRILLSSNAPWSNTGYGVGVRSLLPRLGALPVVGGCENVACFAWYGLQGGMMQAGPFVVYPGFADAYGNDVIGHHARHFGADVVITLIDAWTQVETARRVTPARWWPWFPVDSDPVSERVLEALDGASLPLVYSRFGERALRDAGIVAAYVPHGVEPSIFRILDVETVQAFRRQVFGEAPHVTAMVAANKGQPDRKAFQANLRAWAAFAEETPGARLYLHTDPTPQAGGVNIEALTRALGIDGQVIYPDRYTYYNIGYPAEWMALLYNAVDVLLAASMTEGFGIPLIEAQACGTPVVTTDFASMTELVYFGWATRPADLFWSPLDAWWAWPDVVEIEQRLEWSRTMPAAWPAEWCKMRHAASQTIHELYSWDVLVERYWAQLLEAIAVG